MSRSSRREVPLAILVGLVGLDHGLLRADVLSHLDANFGERGGELGHRAREDLGKYVGSEVELKAIDLFRVGTFQSGGVIHVDDGIGAMNLTEDQDFRS
jgi:hypothetical protein